METARAPLSTCFRSLSFARRSELFSFAFILALAPASAFSDEPNVQVPNGAFTMGEAGAAVPEHSVTLASSFLLDLDEVSNALFRDGLAWAYSEGLVSVDPLSGVVTDIASGEELITLGAGAGDNRCWIGFSAGEFSVEPGKEAWPVVFVSWYGAAAYCDWRSVREGRTAAYDHATWSCGPGGDPYEALGYRLPAEAEWEYAAQFDDERHWPWGSQKPDNTLANYWPASLAHPWETGVHLLGENGLGIRDLAGNVWEWVNDWFELYQPDAVTNPPGPPGGDFRVIRGGGWTTSALFLPCAARGDLDPATQDQNVGFRCARTATGIRVAPMTWGAIKFGASGDGR